MYGEVAQSDQAEPRDWHQPPHCPSWTPPPSCLSQSPLYRLGGCQGGEPEEVPRHGRPHDNQELITPDTNLQPPQYCVCSILSQQPFTRT